MFTDYWKVLVLNFPERRNTVFFEPKSWWKDEIYQLLESSCFELYGDGKYGLFWAKKLMERWYLLITEKTLFWSFRRWEIQSFLSQKVDGKVIFPWSFWAFNDIPGLGKYGFRAVSASFDLYSVNLYILSQLIYIPPHLICIQSDLIFIQSSYICLVLSYMYSVWSSIYSVIF